MAENNLTTLAKRLAPLIKRFANETVIASPGGTGGGVPVNRLMSAGAGLTGGGDLSADRTFNVGPGSGITVNANDVALTTPGTLTVATANNPAGSHTHAITSSTAPGAAAQLLASTAAGALTLVNFGVSGNITSSLIPSLTDTYDLGSSTLLWRKGYLSEMDAVLFAQQTVTLIGGWLLIGPNEGTLAADVAAANTSVDFGQAMTVGHFVLLRAALKVEYMQVGSLVSGTRYNVTRNLDGSGANDWPSGTPYAVLGTTGSGRIELNAYDTPRISIIEQGATYNAQTERIRIGDMTGVFGTGASHRYGIGIGDYAGGNYLSYHAEVADTFRIKASGGLLTIDGTGIGIEASTTYASTREYRFTVGGIRRFMIQGQQTGGLLEGRILADGTVSPYQDAGLILMALASSANPAQVSITAQGLGVISTIDVFADATAAWARITADWLAVQTDLRVGGGLYVGSTSINPAAGYIIANEDILAGSGIQAGSTTGTPGAGEIIGSGQFKATGQGSSYGLLIGGDAQLYRNAANVLRTPDSLVFDGNLRSYKNATEYTGYIYIPLTTHLTSTAWDGDSYSTTNKTLIDLSAVFGAPAGIKAVALQVVIRDSGSAATECIIRFAPNNTSDIGPSLSCAPLNDRLTRGMLIIPCDANGDIYYQIDASGAGTMDVFLQIWGYWI